MVSGEPAIEINTAKYSATIRKSAAKNILNTTLYEGRGSIKLPSLCEMAPGRVNCSNEEPIAVMVSDKNRSYGVYIL